MTQSVKSVLASLMTLSILCFYSLDSSGQSIDLKIGDDRACFIEGIDTVLCFQRSVKSIDGAFARSNYIHPLFTLDGHLMTEDFPEDHLHHRGIFWAWHQLYVGEVRIGDGWEIKNFSWDVKSVKSLDSMGDYQALQTEVLWKSPVWLDQNGAEKPVVKEKTTIQVYPRNDHYRVVDINISMVGMEENMRIGGSEDAKGYGGFSPRIKLPEDVRFKGKQGDIKAQNLPINSEGWLDISGSLGADGSKAGLTILSHTSNPGYPNSWILRSKNSMQNAVYPENGATAVELSHVRPTVLKYRLIVHDGKLSKSEIIKLHSEFNAE